MCLLDCIFLASNRGKAFTMEQFVFKFASVFPVILVQSISATNVAANVGK